MVATRTAEAISSEERAPYRAGEFACAIDTREQKPWRLALSIPVVVKALAVGDYSVVGHEDEVALERKSLDDLVNSIFFSPSRFRRELEKLREFQYAAVIVEATVGDIFGRKYFAGALGSTFGYASGAKRPTIAPGDVLAKIALISRKFVPVFLADSRRHAAALATLHLRQFWEERNR